jgi:hypothetical protein
MTRKGTFLNVFSAVVLLTSIILTAFIGVAHAASGNSINLVRANNQYLSISDDKQTGLDLKEALTIEAWVKLSSLPTPGQSYTIVSKRDGSTNNRQYSFFVYNNSGTYTLSLVLSRNGDNPDSFGKVVWSSPATGTWYHIAATWSASTQTYTAYVNGVTIGTYDSSNDSVPHIYEGGADFKIGAEEGSSINTFDGLIDDVRVWNVVRSASDISSNMSKELAGNETGLVGYWRLNGDLTDSSANGNNLTNNNGANFSSDTGITPPTNNPGSGGNTQGGGSSSGSNNSLSVQAKNFVSLFSSSKPGPSGANSTLVNIFTFGLGAPKNKP